MESSPNLRLVPGADSPAARRVIRVLVVVMLLALIVFPAAMRLSADLFWFNEIGYQRVFMTEIVTKVLLFLIVGVIAYALLSLNLRFARRGVSTVNVFPQQLPESLIELIDRLPRLTTPAAAVFSVLAGISASAAWIAGVWRSISASMSATIGNDSRKVSTSGRIAPSK